MAEEPSVGSTRPFLLGFLAILFVIFGWHYFCHAQLEAALEERTNDSLRATFGGSNASVEIQPVTNLVLIQVELPVHGRNEFANAIGDLAVEYVRMELEPVIERKLATAARADIDLYAMAVPYHVAIDISNVREGFSKLVQDIQEELLRLGYDIGTPDGLNGPRTTRAINDVQIQLNLARDGQASQQLLDILRNAKAASPNTSLERAPD